MNCKRCGAPVNLEDKFCKVCETPIEEISVNNNENNNNVNQKLNLENQQVMNNNYVEEKVQVNQKVQKAQKPQKPKKPKSSKPIIITLILILILLVVIASVFFVKKYLLIEKKVEITFEGVNLKIPANYTFEIQNKTLAINDEKGELIAELSITKGSYSKMSNNIETVKKQFEKANKKVTNLTLQEFGGVEFITGEYIFNEKNIVVGFTQATSTKIFSVGVYNIENTVDYEMLTKIGEILSTAEVIDQTENKNIEFSPDTFNSILNAQ